MRYAAPIDPAVGAEHAAIVAGGSIGAVFAAQGWEVRKTHLSYAERPATAKLAALMRIAAGTPLAEHVYVLDVVKDGRAIEYAALVEIHHPDYLDVGDLAKIYGAVDEGRSELVAQLRATAARARALRLRRRSRRGARSAGRGRRGSPPPSRYRYGGTTLSGGRHGLPVLGRIRARSHLACACRPG